jgi:hypothetical protein
LIREAWAKLQQTQGHWPVLVPCIAILIAAGLCRMSRAVIFASLIFLLSLLVSLSGCWIGATQKLTLIMLQNFRYPLGFLVFGPPLVAGVLAGLGAGWDGMPGRCAWRRWAAGCAAGVALVVGCQQILRLWPRDYDVRLYLQEGEWEVARLAAQQVTEGSDTWLTDRTTVAYYASRPPIFLYTPAGSRWLLLQTEAEAAQALRAARVRLVAFSDQNPDWWTRTPLYAALSRPGFAERIHLPRWELFVLPLNVQPVTAP